MCLVRIAAPRIGAALTVCLALAWRSDRRWARLLRSGVSLLGLGLLFLVAAFLALTPVNAAPQVRQPVRAQVSADLSGGFARLVFAFGDEVDASVHSAGNILIVTFNRPVYLTVEHLSIHASDYIVAARRDPDGRSVRFALSRKVTVNSIEAADKFFVDLLPDTWKGPPPPLPHEVVEELAKRAREVEHLQHLAQLAEQRRKSMPVRVHVASQPTFTRYVFDIPEQTSVSADRAKERLTLSFDTPLTFDMVEVETNLPPVVASVNAETEQDLSLIRFSFMAPVDLRTFRDGKSYVVDIVKDDAGALTRNKALGKPMPLVNGNMEAMPQTTITAESMTVTPPPRAPAVAPSPAAAGEKPVPAPGEIIPPVAPPGPAAASSESMPASTITAQSESPPSAPRPKESESSTEYVPMADDGDGGAGAKIAAEARAAAEAAVAAEAKAAADAKAAAEAKAIAEVKAAELKAATRARAAADAQAMDEARVVANASAAADAKAATEPRIPAQAKIAAESKLATEATVDPAAKTTPGALPAGEPPQAGQTTPAAPVTRPIPTAPHPPAVEASTSVQKQASAAAAAPSTGRQAAGNAANNGAVPIELLRQGASLKLSVRFTEPTAAAVFSRADTLWMVFDSKSAIDVAALITDPSHTIRDAEFSRDGEAAIVRLRLDRPHLSSIAEDGPGWSITIGDEVVDPTRALDITRNLVGQNRASVTVNFEHAQHLHRIHDPDVGDTLWVVTGLAPVRGFIDAHDFVEFHALASRQGIVIAPLADDLHVDISADKVVIGRPGGLTLSSSLQSVLYGTALRPVMFDAQVWNLDRTAQFGERQTQLVTAAAAASPGKRLPQRLDLARFYLAREMYPEAKGVLDVSLAEEHAKGDDITGSVMRAITEVRMNRPDAALKDLANPAIGDQHDAPLWRAMAYAGQGKWAMARESFKRVEASVAALPVELQRVALKTQMRAAIEVGDFAGAAQQFNDIETIGLTHELQPAIAVLVGRLNEGVGRKQEALNAYRTAADSWDRPAAAQGRLREAALRYALGDLKREDVLSELEALTTIWRGDETEIGSLEIMARLYTEEGRYRDSFYVMRNAAAAHPDSDMTRRIQDQAAATFESLFLGGKGDRLSPIEALALFYDFRELTPIGRRGDEMIRRLADRLVAVDLLDQASDLLQYQVDHRLQGAARAQVATRLAVVYLMNRKPDRALAVLRATRMADLAIELRDQRLLLEGRALSDLGRHDLALEVVGHVEGRETIRLRSDILWAAKRWAASAEQIELYYGERWKDWEPLNEVERADILRAATGYALGEDTLGLGRLHEKYAAKMAQTPDAQAFEIASAPLGISGKEFSEIARAAASTDTLNTFLRDMQARFPEAGPAPKAEPSALPPPGIGAPASATVPPAKPEATAPPPAPASAGKSARS
jgi:hypothetical protein